MTRDKIYGKYLHTLLIHAPLQYRLVSGESINCEDEERFFKTIRDITHGTSNNSQGHLIGNLIVRLEVESRCREGMNSIQVNEINDLGLSIHAKELNSLFSYEFIQQNSADWQSHMERISDFLIFENKWWEKTEFGIEFFDFTNEPENRELYPNLHHFRSSNISAITSQLEKQWKFIIENNIGIPTHEILLGNEDEIVRYVSTSFLSDNFFCNTTSYSCRVLSRVDVNKYQEEDGEDDFSNFQYFDAEFLNSNFEKTSHMTSTIKETSLGDHEPSLETSQKTNLETNLDSTIKTDKAVLSDSIHEKLSSTLIGNNDDVQFNVISNVSMVNCNDLAPSSSINSFSSSIYVTQEANTIAMVLGDSPELRKYDRTVI